MPTLTKAQVPERFIIRNAKLRLKDLLGFGILGAFICYGFKEHNSGSYTYIHLAATAYLLVGLIRRLLNRGPKIILDKKGIAFCEEQIFCPWEQIQYAFIRAHEVTAGSDIRQTHYYFHIITYEKEYKKRIDAYEYTAAAVKKAIENYSGRDIGHETDIVRDQISEILGEDGFTPEVMQAFHTFYGRQMRLFFSYLLPIIGTSVFFQLATDFPYCVAFGILFSILVLKSVRRAEEEKFRQQEQIVNLSEEQVNAIMVKYQLRHSRAVTLGRDLFFMVFTIFIFWLSYHLTQS